MACCNYLTVLDRDTWSPSYDSYVIVLKNRDINDFAGNGIPHVHAYETINVRTLIAENERLNDEVDRLEEQVQKLRDKLPH